MVRRGCRTAFTLIEVLLVVVILAVLAGAVIPRYLTTADDAKRSSLTHNLSVMGVQLEIYRAQHLNQYPTIAGNALPQLTASTNSAGEIGAAGPLFPFGPYVLEPPMNPYDGSKKRYAGGCARPKACRRGGQPWGVAIRRHQRRILAEQSRVLPVAHRFHGFPASIPNRRAT